jgi:hypothetical protein
VERTNAPARPAHASGSADADPGTAVHRFVGTLIERYRHLESAPAAGLDASVLDRRLSELVLTEAAIRHAQLPPSPAANRPSQVAVMGPTQTGKSTVVNLLLGRAVAEVSPLAGYTVHPQGFWVTSGDRTAGWADRLFPGWPRCEPDELSRDRLEAYALTLVDSPDDQLTALPACVLWDTPDFDSLAARNYRHGLLEVAALADAIILVLSKEKYSDLSVWRMLRLVEPLRRPLLICLNKLTPEAADVVTASLRQRLAEIRGDDCDVPIATVEYQPGLVGDAQALPPEVVGELRQHLSTRLAAAPARGRTAGVQALIKRHWDDWVAPLRAEHAATEAWNRQLGEALARFLEAYQRDYLDHPQRYDSFRRAAIELLHLLEIPKISGWMTRARQVASWPARQLLTAGRSWWGQRRGRARAMHDLGTEATVLLDAVDGLLTSLQRDAARQCEPSSSGWAVWRAVTLQLEREERRLRQVFRNAIEEHHRQVAREIHAAANRLYEELQAQPARLAALRTARTTIDVGYLLVAVKTGGLTPLDALWAPATFGLTSLLMEGLAGLQMGHVARRLKKKQYEAVQKVLIESVFLPELRALAANLEGEGLFAIPPEHLAEATAALGAWEPTERPGELAGDRSPDRD